MSVEEGKYWKHLLELGEMVPFGELSVHSSAQLGQCLHSNSVKNCAEMVSINYSISLETSLTVGTVQ